MYPYDPENEGTACQTNSANRTATGAQYAADVQAKMGYEPYRSDPLSEMQKRNIEVEREHSKRAEGIQFLMDNPQFNQFIELIRKGSIQI